MNITVSSCSHWLRVKPISRVKKVGRNTRKPNCEAVLIARTTAPIPIFGWRHMMVRLDVSVASGC